MRTRALLCSALLLAGGAGGCRPGYDPAALEPVPRPRVEAFEPPARRQLQEARRELDRRLAALGGGPIREPETLAERYGRVGRLYLAYQLRAAAAGCFHNASALAPGDRRWHYYRAVASRAEGRFDEAAAAFERALSLAPEEPPVLLRLAELEIERRRLRRARELLGRALGVDPGGGARAAALYGLGRIETLEGRPGQAVERFRAALELQPRASAVHHALGLALRDAGDVEGARRELAAGGPRPPSFPDPLFDGLSDLVLGTRAQVSRGAEALRHGEFEAAEAHFRRASELDPDDAVAHYNLGTVLGESGRHEAARAALAEAVRLDPGMADAWLNLGTALAALGRLEEAEAALGRAVELTPEDEVASQRSAIVRRALGRDPALPAAAGASEGPP